MSLFQQVANYSEARNGRAVVFYRKGKLAAEHYHNGGGVNEPWGVHSITKSITSLLIARMQQLGLLHVDQLACTILTEWQPDPVKSTIKIEHLLTHSAGIQNVFFAEITYAAAVALPVTGTVGVFNYDNVYHIILGEIIRRVTGQDPVQYLREVLLRPAGLNITGTWGPAKTGVVGEPDMASGCRCTAREIGAIGDFMRQGGRLGVLSPAVIADWTEPCDAYRVYARSLWLTMDAFNDIIAGNADPALDLPFGGYAMYGLGSNLVMVFPEIPDEDGGPLTVARVGFSHAGVPAFSLSDFANLCLVANSKCARWWS